MTCRQAVLARIESNESIVCPPVRPRRQHDNSIVSLTVATHNNSRFSFLATILPSYPTTLKTTLDTELFVVQSFPYLHPKDKTIGMLRSIASCTRRSVVSKSQSSVYFFERRGTREFSSMDAEDVSFKGVYTHPLSQTVLEHLQNVHGEWLMRNGLDRGLTINRGEHV